MTTELVTFGETMIRLSPPDHQRLEQAHTLDLHVGGSEFNTAVAAARLGISTAYVTRLTRNPLGRMIENKSREHGIDTSAISWTDDARIGTYYAEFGASPRANSVVYDRAGSAFARIEPQDVDWRAVLEGVRVLHTSGITPALSSSSAETTLAAVHAAKEAGALISVDLNYRARLWSQEKACEVMTAIVELSDILITTEEDTERVYGITADSYETVARRLARRFDLRVVAITLRENPSVWRNTWTAIVYERKTDSIHCAPKYNIEVVDRVGSGDAFSGGFLYGMLRDGPAAGVRYGVGLSAIKQTHPGDVCWSTLTEVERVLEGSGLRIVR